MVYWHKWLPGLRMEFHGSLASAISRINRLYEWPTHTLIFQTEIWWPAELAWFSTVWGDGEVNPEEFCLVLDPDAADDIVAVILRANEESFHGT